jgi:hypothetical protein
MSDEWQKRAQAQLSQALAYLDGWLVDLTTRRSDMTHEAWWAEYDEWVALGRKLDEQRSQFRDALGMNNHYRAYGKGDVEFFREQLELLTE